MSCTLATPTVLLMTTTLVTPPSFKNWWAYRPRLLYMDWRVRWPETDDVKTTSLFLGFTHLTLTFLSGPEGQEVLLVTIPEFSSTQTACLVNIRTLECEPIRFSAFSAEDYEESEMNVSH